MMIEFNPEQFEQLTYAIRCVAIAICLLAAAVAAFKK